MADDLSLKAKRLLARQYDKLLLDRNTVAKASGVLRELLNQCEKME